MLLQYKHHTSYNSSTLLLWAGNAFTLSIHWNTSVPVSHGPQPGEVYGPWRWCWCILGPHVPVLIYEQSGSSQHQTEWGQLSAEGSAKINSHKAELPKFRGQLQSLCVWVPSLSWHLQHSKLSVQSGWCPVDSIYDFELDQPCSQFPWHFLPLLKILLHSPSVNDSFRSDSRVDLRGEILESEGVRIIK